MCDKAIAGDCSLSLCYFLIYDVSVFEEFRPLKVQILSTLDLHICDERKIKEKSEIVL